MAFMGKGKRGMMIAGKKASMSLHYQATKASSKPDDELLGKKGLKRVARQAGVGLFNHLSFQEVRRRIRRWLGNTLWDAGTLARHCSRRTLKKSDLIYALDRQSATLCG